MSKPKLDMENIQNSEQARSIVNLLYYHAGEEGLEPKYIRYALGKNYATQDCVLIGRCKEVR